MTFPPVLFHFYHDCVLSIWLCFIRAHTMKQDLHMFDHSTDSRRRRLLNKANELTPLDSLTFKHNPFLDIYPRKRCMRGWKQFFMNIFSYGTHTHRFKLSGGQLGEEKGRKKLFFHPFKFIVEVHFEIVWRSAKTYILILRVKKTCWIFFFSIII